MAERRAEPTPEKPSVTNRVFYGILGAAIGGTIGHGLATSGPVPPEGRDVMSIVWWSGGLAVVSGAIAAISPSGFWRPKGGWPAGGGIK